MAASKKPKEVIKSKYNRLTPATIKKFLKSLEKTGNISASAAYVGVTPTAIHRAKDRIEGFADEIEVARNKAAHEIEMEMRKRAIDGVEEDVYHNGEIVGVKVRYSDNILMKLAQAASPDRYGSPSENLGGNSIKVQINGDSAVSRLADLLKVPDPNSDSEKKTGNVLSEEGKMLDD